MNRTTSTLSLLAVCLVSLTSTTWAEEQSEGLLSALFKRTEASQPEEPAAPEETAGEPAQPETASAEEISTSQEVTPDPVGKALKALFRGVDRQTAEEPPAAGGAEEQVAENAAPEEETVAEAEPETGAAEEENSLGGVFRKIFQTDSPAGASRSHPSVVASKTTRTREVVASIGENVPSPSQVATKSRKSLGHSLRDFFREFQVTEVTDVAHTKAAAADEESENDRVVESALRDFTFKLNGRTFDAGEILAHSFSEGDQPIAIRVVRTTAYTHTEDDHVQWGNKSAIGDTLKATTRYTSAAADWSRIPLGTKFRIKGNPTIYVVDDYGSALVGTNTIDLYKPSKDSMNRWGARHVEIEILEIGSYALSRALLASRIHEMHCRQMYEALAGRG